MIEHDVTQNNRTQIVEKLIAIDRRRPGFGVGSVTGSVRSRLRGSDTAQIFDWYTELPG